MPAINVGDRVRYSRGFCKSIGAIYGCIPHARGTVTAIEQHGRLTLAVIDWAGTCDVAAERVGVWNLVREDRVPFEGA